MRRGYESEQASCLSFVPLSRFTPNLDALQAGCKADVKQAQRAFVRALTHISTVSVRLSVKRQLLLYRKAAAHNAED